MLESQFQHIVIKMAEEQGWLVYHVANVRGQLRAKSSVGFPDLILIKNRIVAWECKRKGRSATEEQTKWITAFAHAGVESRVITEDDFTYIIRVLANKDLSALTRLNLTLEEMKASIDAMKRGRK